MVGIFKEHHVRMGFIRFENFRFVDASVLFKSLKVSAD